MSISVSSHQKIQVQKPHTTHHNPCKHIHPRQRQIQNISSYIIKVHIERPNNFLELLLEVRVLIIQRLLHTQLGFEPLALFCGPGNGDNTCTEDFADLTGEGASCARGAGDDEGFTCFELADVGEALSKERVRRYMEGGSG